MYLLNIILNYVMKNLDALVLIFMIPAETFCLEFMTLSDDKEVAEKI